MTQGWNGPQSYPPPGSMPPAIPPPAPQNNVVGLIALIVGIIGFVFACVPGALVVGWVLLPIAFVLGIVGVCLSGKSKGTSIGAIVVSIVGVVVGVLVFLTAVSNAFSDAFKDTDLASPSSSRSGIADQRQTPTSEAAEPGSRTDPFQIGETVTNSEWEITLGQPTEAGAQIAAENQFNDPPSPGMEFWIVPVTAKYIGDETGNLTFGVTVKFVGSDNRTYEDSCGVLPNPLSDIGDLYPGGSATGNTCVAVPAGANGLWALSTGFVGNPVFFTSR